MSYYYVSATDLNKYVRKLKSIYSTPQDLLDAVEESIQVLEQDLDYDYADEIKFYQRVKGNILTIIDKEKFGKVKEI
jgi:predicted RNA-binding protein with EMAP domain